MSGRNGRYGRYGVNPVGQGNSEESDGFIQRTGVHLVECMEDEGNVFIAIVQILRLSYLFGGVYPSSVW